ncbi:YesL family protein [Rathayibacter sp. CAU 1779]
MSRLTATVPHSPTASSHATQSGPRRSGAAARASVSRGVNTWVVTVAEFVTWIAKVNLAWIVLTLMGGIVLGFAPAAFATVAMCRERLRSGHDPRLGEFLATWRRDFWRANAVLLPVAVVDALIVTAFTLVVQASVLLAIVVGVVVLVAVLATVLLPVLYANYELPLARYVPTATRFVLSNPVSMLLLALTCAAVAVVSVFVPALVVFVSIGAWVQFSTALCLSFFHYNDERLAPPAEPDVRSH